MKKIFFKKLLCLGIFSSVFVSSNIVNVVAQEILNKEEMIAALTIEATKIITDSDNFEEIVSEEEMPAALIIEATKIITDNDNFEEIVSEEEMPAALTIEATKIETENEIFENKDLIIPITNLKLNK